MDVPRRRHREGRDAVLRVFRTDDRKRRRKLVRTGLRLSSLLVALLVVACGGGGGSGDNSPSPTPSSRHSSPAKLTIVQPTNGEVFQTSTVPVKTTLEGA